MTTLKISDSDVSRVSAALSAIPNREIRRGAFQQAQCAMLDRYAEGMSGEWGSKEECIHIAVEEALRVINIIRVINHY